MARKEELTFIIRAKNLFAKGFADARKGLRNIAKSAANMARSIGVGVAAAAAVMVAFGKSALAAYKTQARAEANLAATLKATGYAAGFTASQLKKQASEMQKMTGVGDEVIIKSQAILATFKEVKGDTFTQATAAIVDMATVMSGASGDAADLQSATVMVGKALNEPIKGIAALRRVGVQLTKQQEEQIRAFVESGQVAKAQAVILGELQSQFGGAAKALDGNVKAIDVLKAAYGDMKEQIGKAIAENETFTGWIEALQSAIEKLASSGALEEWTNSAINNLGLLADMAMEVVNGIKAIGRFLQIDKLAKGARMIGGTIGGAMGGMTWGDALDAAAEEEKARPTRNANDRRQTNAQRQAKQAETQRKEELAMLTAQSIAAIASATDVSDAVRALVQSLQAERRAVSKAWAVMPDMREDQMLGTLNDLIAKHEDAQAAFNATSFALEKAYQEQSHAAEMAAEAHARMAEQAKDTDGIAAAERAYDALATKKAMIPKSQRATQEAQAIAEETETAWNVYQTALEDAKLQNDIAAQTLATRKAELEEANAQVKAAEEAVKVAREQEKALGKVREQAQGIKKALQDAQKEAKLQVEIEVKTAKLQAAIASFEKARDKALIVDVRDPRQERAELFERKARKERIRDETREDRDRARRIRERMANLSPLGRIRRRDREWLAQYEEGRARIRTAEQAEKQIAKREAMIARLAQKTVDHLAAIRENLDTLLRAS